MIRPLATFDRISQSMGKLYTLFEKPRIACYTVAALLAVHTGLLMYSAYVHSPTLNEPGHLVAGLSHWKFGRYELYRVNPPLVRMVAALPVMAVGYEDDWSGYYEGPGSRPVFSMGEDFVAANGERSFYLFMIARWACIPFSWIGGIVCYLWARDLGGRPAGVFACTLWCFSPNVLAHASLITADAAGAALGVAACYTFWRWLNNPTWTQAALTGIVLGIAELAKTTLILFYPLWPLLWVAYRWGDRHEMDLRDWTREAGMLLLRMAIGLYVLNLGYGFEGSGKQLKEFHFVSNLLTGKELSDESQEPEKNNPTSTQQHSPSASSTNRFRNSWLGHLFIPFPANYLHGIDIQQCDFEDYGRPSYLRGEWQDHGWWHYYLYAAAIKVPLGTWLIGLIGVLHLVFEVKRGAWRTNIPRDYLILLLPPTVVFIVCSSKTGFSEHFRYVLPCFPFLFIWISCFSTTLPNFNENFLDRLKLSQYITEKRIRRLLVSSATLILLLWSVTSSLWIYPHSLSYFNEAIGGPLNGPNHLLGSNIDWGQGLVQLKKWQLRIRIQDLEDGSLHLAYYGDLNPALLGFGETFQWPLQQNFSPQFGVQEGQTNERPLLEDLTPGYYAISVNLLHGFHWHAQDGGNLPMGYVQPCILQLLREAAPHSQAGYSIRIYRILHKK